MSIGACARMWHVCYQETQIEEEEEEEEADEPVDDTNFALKQIITNIYFEKQTRAI